MKRNDMFISCTKQGKKDICEQNSYFEGILLEK